MNLRQLRFISAVARNGLNISAAAESLFTSQPGVSKQIRQLEDELRVQIFERHGKQLTRITAAGNAIIERAERALVEIETLRQAALEHSDPHAGSLSIAASHTQARYVLPPIVREFKRRYPRITLHIHQGTPAQMAQLVHDGEVDFVIATEAMEHFEDLVLLPCYQWNRAVMVPIDHPLSKVRPLTLEAVAEHPIVTYVFGFTGRSVLDAAFRARDLTPEVVFTATDTDVIKTYVRIGLGIGIIARLAYDADFDEDLEVLDASHLFAASTTKIGFRRGIYLRAFMYEFLEMFAAHLTRERVDTALNAAAKASLDPLFADLPLPVY